MMSNLLVMRTEGEDKLTKAKDEKDNEVIGRRLAYEKCRGGCECEGDKCLAAGLYLCRYCNTYKKKKCGVAKCAKQYEDEGCTDQPLPKKPVVKATKPAALRATKKRKRASNQKSEESESESTAESEEASDSDDETMEVLANDEAEDFDVGNCPTQ